MKDTVLLICSSALFPTNSGDKIYSLNQLKVLSKKFEVVLVNVIEEEFDEELNLSNLQKFCSKIYFFKETYFNQGFTALKSFYSGKPSIITRSKHKETITARLNQIIIDEKPGFVLIDHLRSSIYMDPNTIKTYLIEHNDEVKIFEQNYKVSLNPGVKITYFILTQLLKQYRDNIYRLLEKIIFISSFDFSDNFKNAHILKKLMIRFDHKEYQIPNRESSRKNILFCGSMHWHPNVKAIQWFLDNVFDKLQKNVNVIIVGRHIPKSLMAHESERILLYSDVPSMEEYFLKSDVFFVPMLTGGGINIKMLEALSYGIPIVATDFSLRGYEGLEFLEPTNNAEEFASKINHLINNPDQALLLQEKELEYYRQYVGDSETDFLNLLKV